MAFDVAMTVRRTAVPFLAGAAATGAALHGLYATATVALLVALWTAVLIGQASALVLPSRPAPVEASRADDDERRRLRPYLDLSPAPLVAMAEDQRLRAVNRAARRLFRSDELVAAPPLALLRTIRDTEPGRSSMLHIATGDGTDHAFALVTVDLDNAHARIRVAALIDIDADLRAAEATTLHELVTVLGHEVTNTLTPIASLAASAAALLAEPVPDLAQAREAIDIVSRRALAFQRFGEAYRDFARLPAPARTRFDLVSVVADLAQLFRTRWPAIALTIEAPATLDLHGDPDQIAQALWAVMDNAADAGQRVQVDVTRSGLGAEISIRDDGPGVPAEQADAIFRPFFTTKSSGSGVGLALARQVFRAHGGDLTLVQAKPYTTFSAVC